MIQFHIDCEQDKSKIGKFDSIVFLICLKWMNELINFGVCNCENLKIQW